MNERNIIAKNAHELFQKNPELFSGRLEGIPSKKDWKFVYEWDTEFKKYFRGAFENVSEMISFYDHPEAFVGSLHLEWHLRRATLFLTNIFTQIPKDSRTLVFGTLDIVSLALATLILRELGGKNTALNILSNPTINGSTKSFEAYSILLSYSSVSHIGKGVQKETLWLKELFESIQGAEHFYYFEEDETHPPYTPLILSESIRSQIWQKPSRMIYRLGLTPDKIFIESKKISHILVADASGESGPSAIALEGVAKELGPKKLKYISGTKRVETLGFEAGVYEAYLREEGQKYQAVQDGYTEASDETSGEEVKLKKKSSKSTRSTYIYTETDRVQALSIAKEKRSIAFLYLGVIPLLFLGMLITLGTPPKSTTTNSNTVVRSSSWWNTNWSSGGSNSSWTSNASKNTSSISTSFWGGGFSRWGGSSVGGGG